MLLIKFYEGSFTDYIHKRSIEYIPFKGTYRIEWLGAIHPKRWILGTHQGESATYHLQSYLEEFTFRFNRRLSKHRELVFRRLLEQVVETSLITEKDVIYGYDWDKEKITENSDKNS